VQYGMNIFVCRPGPGLPIHPRKQLDQDADAR
jgi:hypothetical protein